MGNIDKKRIVDCINMASEYLSKRPEQLGDPELRFDSGVMMVWEGYKKQVYDEARSILGFDSWTQESIGTGRLLNKVIDALNLKENNLIDKEFNLRKYIAKMREDVPLSERTIYEIYCGLDDQSAFENATKAWGRKYDLIGFLFFLKDKEKYLPIRPKSFEYSLSLVDANTVCTDGCTWEHYIDFIDTIEKVQEILMDELDIPVELIDAHSFVWLIPEFVGKPRTKREKSQDNHQRFGEALLLQIGDDVSNLLIYEVINKYFGKKYRGWGQAWFDVDDEVAAWFPTIYKTNDRPSGNYGGTARSSNTLSADGKTIIEINHDEPATPDGVEKYDKVRLVFGRIDGAFKFLGVFRRSFVSGTRYRTYRHERIAKGINLTTGEILFERNVNLGTFGNWQVNSENNVMILVPFQDKNTKTICIPQDVCPFFSQEDKEIPSAITLHDKNKSYDVQFDVSDEMIYMKIGEPLCECISAKCNQEWADAILCLTRETNNAYTLSFVSGEKAKVQRLSDDEIELSELEEERTNEAVLKSLDESSARENIADYVAVPEERKMVDEDPKLPSKVAYPRDASKRVDALKRARFSCEYNSSHASFISKRTNLPYMETHHLIPLERWREFGKSLDVLANIVCLCSNCHNEIHYGKNAGDLVRSLFMKRATELKDAGISLPLETLLQMYRVDESE